MKKNVFFVDSFHNPGISPYQAHNLFNQKHTPSFIFEQNTSINKENRMGYVCISPEKILRTGKREGLGEIDPFKLINDELLVRKNSTIIPNSEDIKEIYFSGAFGYLSYECFKYIEPSIKNIKTSKIYTPEAGFIFAKELLVFDNKKNLIYLIIKKEKNRTEEYIKKRQLEIKKKILNTKQIKKYSKKTNSYIHKSNISTKKFKEMISIAINEINNGELIQVVLSRRSEIKIHCNPDLIYFELKKINFSPYTYFLNFGDFQIIGASPELMSKTKNKKTEIHPIAGTYPRDLIPQKDKINEKNMLVSEKENAEHLMLVDLARNDLGKVCTPGTVMVENFMSVERYSHVMHLVSKVSGILKENFSGIDALKSGFPIGTLTGAPKIRAIKMAGELEPEGRGPYCGAIGWFENINNIDTGTLIRSIIIKKDKAHIHGGAGIVSESSPSREYEETEHKIQACLQAIKIANRKSDTYRKNK